MNHSPPRFFWRACCCFALLRASTFGEQTPPAAPIPTWKDEIAKNYLPYHQLMLEDFPINDEAHPEMAYWVQPFVHYYYHYLSKVSPGGMIYLNVTDWTVFSGFDRNLSTRNSKFREMKMFLPYIQALFDISDLHARQLGALKAGELPSAEGKTFTQARAQLEDRVAALVQIRAWEAQKETDAFREATKNGQNQKKVRELATAIKKRLAGIPSAESTDGSDHAEPIAEFQHFAENKVTQRYRNALPGARRCAFIDHGNYSSSVFVRRDGGVRFDEFVSGGTKRADTEEAGHQRISRRQSSGRLSMAGER